MVIATNLTILSVASIRGNLLKQLMLKNVASMQIQKVVTFYSDHKKVNLIPNKSFIDNFWTHSYVDDIS